MTTTITWTPITERLPDDESTVLLGLADGFSCEGFLDGDQWRDVCATPLLAGEVTHWAEMPRCEP